MTHHDQDPTDPVSLRSGGKTVRARAAVATLAALVSVGLLAGCSDGDSPDNAGGAECGTETVADVSLRDVVTDDLVINSDGSQVAADSATGLTRWSTDDGSIAQIDPRSLVATSPDFSRAIETRDGGLVLVDTETDEVATELSTAPCEIGAIAFSDDGSAVAAVDDEGAVTIWDDEGAVTIWDAETGEAESGVGGAGSGGGAGTVAISPDGARVATGGGTEITVYEIESGEALHTFAGSGDGSVSVVWSPDGRFIAGAGSASTVTVWDADTFEPVAETDAALQQLAFAPDSMSLAFTVDDETAVRLWAPPELTGLGDTSPAIRALEGHTQPPGALVFDADGTSLYTIAETDYVRAWDVATAAPADVTFEKPPSG